MMISLSILDTHNTKKVDVTAKEDDDGIWTITFKIIAKQVVKDSHYFHAKNNIMLTGPKKEILFKFKTIESQTNMKHSEYFQQ